ncbi:hypothetical protein Q669_31545 [Labrenzia sp. C1B10]|uniref:DUF805 domain-containing protein n=1 Tax=unclassified Labrenzia TaxID=2648686 RepID=UPI0003B89D9E|nr:MULTISPECIES: DUF805 domain-containing protein [unclassified Labrenzia]ERP94456.1 hypothetical protein Q669_31545 [Labrenzia sp. C1B10]ERS09569.1 hypothetical protein Q675_00125 [Labrenzia sp. C1B70]
MVISIWQILIITSPLIFTLVALLLTSKAGKLGRTEFFLRLLVISAIAIFVGGIGAVAPPGNPVIALLILATVVLIGFYSFRIQILRLQDMGQSRFFVFLSFVPLVNLLFLLFLIFAPGRP